MFNTADYMKCVAAFRSLSEVTSKCNKNKDQTAYDFTIYYNNDMYAACMVSTDTQTSLTKTDAG